MSVDVYSGALPGLFNVLSSLENDDVEHLTLLSETAFHQVFPSEKSHRQVREQEIEIKEKDSKVAALNFLFRNAYKLGLNANNFENQLKSNSALSDSIVKAIIKVWNQKESIRKSEALKFINIGKLVDMQWKFGVAVTSNSCKTLKMPYVTMVITVADSSSSLITKSFDMDLQEFRNFSKQMKDMASALET